MLTIDTVRTPHIYGIVIQDYVEKVWQFDGEEQRLLCSNMSSTG